jgi:hypothetical protein
MSIICPHIAEEVDNEFPFIINVVVSWYNTSIKL